MPRKLRLVGSVCFSNSGEMTPMYSVDYFISKDGLTFYLQATRRFNEAAISQMRILL